MLIRDPGSTVTAGRRRATIVALGCLIVSTLLAGCTGSGGVELGDDWAGSQTFVVATMSGLTTVLGVDPDRRRAEPLLVVPQHRDDDAVLAPQIVRLAGAHDNATWLLAVPRRDGAPSRLYRVNPASHSLVAAGDVEAGRSLVPNGPHAVAGVGGADGDGSSSSDTVLRYIVRLDDGSARTLSVRDDVSLTGTGGYTSGGSDGVCATGDTHRGTAVQRLASASATPRTWLLRGLQATAIDCAGEHTVVAARPLTPDAAATSLSSTPPPSPTGAAPPGAAATGSTAPLHLEGRRGLDVVTGGPDLVSRVLDTPAGVVAATQGPRGCALHLMSRSTGQVTARIALDLSGIDTVVPTTDEFVVIGADRAASVTRDLRTAAAFDLPATVTATP